MQTDGDHDILSQRAKAKITCLRSDAYQKLELAGLVQDMLDDRERLLQENQNLKLDKQTLQTENQLVKTENHLLHTENQALKQSRQVVNNFNAPIDAVNITAAATPVEVSPSRPLTVPENKKTNNPLNS